VVIFNIFRALKYSSNEINIYRIDIVQEMADNEHEKLALDDPLRCLIAYSTEKEVENASKEVLDKLKHKTTT
jgi:hypothetical protein